MKKILLSLGSILFAGAVLAGGTGAFLSDTQSSTGNTFASTLINLKVDNESYYTDQLGHLALSATTTWALSDLAGKLFYNFLDIKPGDQGESTISLHVNNTNAWACMNIKETSTPENGTGSPENQVDNSTSTNAGELQNNLYFSFWADDGDNVYEAGEKIFKQGYTGTIFDGSQWTLADASKNIWGSGPLPGNTTQYIGEAWCFGTSTPNPVAQDGQGKTGSNGPLVRGTGFVCSGANVGNIVQSDGIKADVSFTTVQSANNASFLCSGAVLGTTTDPVVTTKTLFSDDFNSSCVKGKDFNKIDNAKWDTTGKVLGDDWGSPYGKVAFLDAGHASPKVSTLTTTAFSTTAYHNITLKYDRNIDAPVGAPLTLTVAYSTDNGSTWTTLETTGVDSDTTTKMFSLSPSADNKAAVKVRFSVTATNSSDHVYIDNVSVTGITP